MIIDRQSGRINWQLLVIGLLALAVPIALALQFSLPTAKATLPVDKCQSCSAPDGVQGMPDPGTTIQWDQKVPIWKLYVQPYTNGQKPTFYDSSFQKVSDARVRQMIESLPKNNVSALELAILKPLPRDYSNDPVRPMWGFQVGCYYVRLSWEIHYVGSCIGRNNWHLGFMVKNVCANPERMILNAHACVWWQNGPQFGLYNSANGWCAQSRGTWTEIRDRVYAGLAAVGVGGFVGYVIADVSTGIVVFAFGL